jgi:hypothetical protein
MVSCGNENWRRALVFGSVALAEKLLFADDRESNT